MKTIIPVILFFCSNALALDMVYSPQSAPFADAFVRKPSESVSQTFENNLTVSGSAFSVGGSTLVVSGGKVGVGASAPTNRLHVAGPEGVNGNTPVTYTPLVVDNAQNSGISVLSGRGYVGTIEFADEDADTQGRIRYSHTDDSMQFFSSGTVRMAITGTGSVGIGNTAPASKVDISSGTIRMFGTGAPTVGGALCLNSAGAMAKCTSAVDASGNCTCP